MKNVSRAKNERAIAIAIGVIMVMLIVVFVVKKRLNSTPQPETVPLGTVVAETGHEQEEVFEDLFPVTTSPTTPVSDADAGGVPTRTIIPPQQPIEAEIDVSVGGAADPPGEPPRIQSPPRETAATPDPPAENVPVVVVERTTTPRTDPVYYLVQKGDTLSSIAEQFYGQASDWVIIKRANKLAAANMLHVGRKLLIPKKEDGTSLRVPVTQTQSRTRVPSGTYVVKKGNSLWQIADEVYGDGKKWRLIFQANRNILKKKNDLKVGQILKIPR